MRDPTFVNCPLGTKAGVVGIKVRCQNSDGTCVPSANDASGEMVGGILVSSSLTSEITPKSVGHATLLLVHQRTTGRQTLEHKDGCLLEQQYLTFELRYAGLVTS